MRAHPATPLLRCEGSETTLKKDKQNEVMMRQLAAYLSHPAPSPLSLF
jgi:hypothetical protein